MNLLIIVLLYNIYMIYIDMKMIIKFVNSNNKLIELIEI